MFDQIFDSMRKMTEMNVQVQQEMFKRWVALWPGQQGFPTVNFAEQTRSFQQKWAETVAELTNRQRESQKEQFAAGLQQIEQVFQLAEIKDVAVLRARTLELWQKTFQLLQQTSEVQVRDFQAAVAKWTELLTTAA